MGTAVMLLWASFAIGVSRGLMDWSQTALQWSKLSAEGSPQLAHTISIAVVVAALGIPALLNVLTAKGYNWARLLNLGLFVLGTVILLFMVSVSSAINSTGTILELVRVVVEAAAFILLFRPAASAWFRPPKPA